MKLRDTFYSQNGFVNTTHTLDRWLKHKSIFWRWITNDYLQRVYGIKLQPKHRHKRSIKARDYGRLFNCTKFYYDPFLNEKETMNYFEELERLREIEGYKE